MEREQNQNNGESRSSEVFQLAIASENGKEKIEKQELLYDQLTYKAKDAEDQEQDQISEPLKYYIKFEKTHVDAHSYSTLMNVLFYSAGSKITRLNIDSMRRKLKQELITQNKSMAASKDLRVLTEYEPDNDDKRFLIDKKKGFGQAKYRVDTGQPARKVLKMSVLDELGLLIVLLSTPQMQKESTLTQIEQKQGLLQVYCYTSMKKLTERHISSQSLRNPDNFELDADLKKLQMWLDESKIILVPDKRKKKHLLILHLCNRLIFLTLEQKSESFEITCLKEIQFDERLKLEFQEDFLYTNQSNIKPPSARSQFTIFIDIQKIQQIPNLERLDLNSSAFFQIKINFISSIIRTTTKDGKKQIQLTNGDTVSTYKLLEEQLSQTRQQASSSVERLSDYEPDELEFSEDMKTLKPLKQTQLKDADGQPVKIIMDGVRVDNGILYTSARKLMLFQEDKLTAVSQIDIDMGAKIQEISTDGKLLKLLTNSTVRLLDLKEMTFTTQKINMKQSAKKVSRSSVMAKVGKELGFSKVQLETAIQKNKTTEKRHSQSIELGSFTPIIDNRQYLSADICVLPMVLDENGLQHIMMIDLSFGELSNSHMHQKVQIDLQAPNYKQDACQTIIGQVYHSYGELRIPLDKDAEPDSKIIDLSTSTKKELIQILSQTKQEKDFEFIVDQGEKIEYKVVSEHMFINQEGKFKWLLKKDLKSSFEPLAAKIENWSKLQFGSKPAIQCSTNQEKETVTIFSDSSKTVHRIEFPKAFRSNSAPEITSMVRSRTMRPKSQKGSLVTENVKTVEFKDVDLTFEEKYAQNLIHLPNTFYETLMKQAPDSELAKKWTGIDISEEMLISNDRQTFVFFSPNQVIYREETKEYIQLNESSDDECHKLYWMTEDYVVRQTQKTTGLFQIFSTVDGSKIATLSQKEFIFIDDRQNCRNCQRQIIAIQEKKTQRIYSATLESILHLGQLHCLTLQFKNLNKYQAKKIKIFGQPAPASVPKLVQDFAISDQNYQFKLAKKINSYTLTKDIRVEPELESVCKFNNVLHFLTNSSFEKSLQKLIKTSSPQIAYVSSPFSPITRSTLVTFKPLMEFISNYSWLQKIKIYKDIDFEEIDYVSELQKDHFEQFFTSMILPLKEMPEMSPFDKNLAVLHSEPFCKIERVEELAWGKKYPKDDFQQWEKLLIQSDEQQQAVEYFALMTPFCFRPGSTHSIRFIKVISGKPHVLHQLFQSKAVQKIVFFKFKLVKTFGYFIGLTKCMYIICLSFYSKNWIMIFWFLLQSGVKGIQMTGRWDGSMRLFLKQNFNFWNFLEFARLFLLLTSITQGNKNKSIFAFLQTISWFTLLTQLRLFQSFQFILTLLPQSVEEMSAFFIVLILINFGFMLGYQETIQSDMAEYDMQISTFMGSWVLNFGEFVHIQLDSGTQIVLFFFWSIALPLLCMNLLIAFLSDTYERVYDQREKANFIEIVNLVLDLETLMIWNRNKSQISHLVYAEAQEESIKESDITMGIGQKVSNMGKRVNKQIKDSMYELREKNIESEEKMTKLIKSIQDENKELKEKLLKENKEVEEANQAEAQKVMIMLQALTKENKELKEQNTKIMQLLEDLK